MDCDACKCVQMRRERLNARCRCEEKCNAMRSEIGDVMLCKVRSEESEDVTHQYLELNLQKKNS
jgi:hypothetical protein